MKLVTVSESERIWRKLKVDGFEVSWKLEDLKEVKVVGGFEGSKFGGVEGS
jgi:hypothetical protein